MKIPTTSIYCSSKIKHAKKWLKLRSQGWNIVSSWIDEADSITGIDFRDLAIRCIDEPKKADVTILYAESKDVFKYSLAEVGAALSENKKVIIVGNSPCISPTFLMHPCVRSVNNLKEALALLRV